MRNLVLILTGLFLVNVVLSQNSIENVLDEVAKNNVTLKAARQSTDAIKIGNRSGIYPENPELEFAYLWGNPESIGNRTDFSAIQKFDFPSAYFHKNRISDLLSEQAEIDYTRQLKEIMFETKLVCFDLISLNALVKEYSNRLESAKNIADLYKSRFDAGEINILEYNKSKLNLLNAEKKLESVSIKKNSIMAELKKLNGGRDIDFNISEFEKIVLDGDFEAWYIKAENSNPSLQWLKKEIDISRKQVSLSRSLELPEFVAGYMSETIINQQFRGITAGISIPLWENRNKTKFARAKSVAAENYAEAGKLQFYSDLKALHAKAFSLQKNLDDYRIKMAELDNTRLLNKAFDKGEISILELMLELSIYYESKDALIELERDLNKTVAELNKYL